MGELIDLLMTSVPHEDADVVLLGKTDAGQSILIISDVNGILYV